MQSVGVFQMPHDRIRRHSSLPHTFVGLVATGLLVYGCVPSQKCNVQKMRAGQRLVTLVYHLRRNEDPGRPPLISPWAQEYPEVFRGEYAIDGNAVTFAQGGVVYGRSDFLQSSPADLGADDIVVVASPDYVGCGSEYLVVYWDGRYGFVSPGSAEFNQARQLVQEWSGGRAK
jgi:hypothetical protein